MKPRPSVVLTDIYVLTVKVLNAFGVRTSADKQSGSERSKAYPFSGGWRIAFLPLLLPISAAAQTTIVVRRTPSEIVVGADSRAAHRDRTFDLLGQTHDTVTYSSICKIVVVDNRAFVVAGYIGDPAGRVDVINIGRVALQTAPKIVEAADLYSRTAEGPLRDSLERLRLLDLETYRKLTRGVGANAKNFSDVAFLAVENGIPTFAARSFITTNDEAKPVSLASVSVNIPNKALPHKLTVTAMAGHHEEIIKYRSDAPFWLKHGNVDGIITLIKIMEAASEEVGGPIDIIRITKKGAEWIQHKKECPDVQNTPLKPTKRRPRR